MALGGAVTDGLTAAEVIALLELTPHPEGGHYRETWRADAPEGTRASGTAIYFLLAEGERSALAPGRCGGDLALVRRRGSGA